MNILNKAIKIISLEMNRLYDYQNNNGKYLGMGKAVLDYSLFSEYMSCNGLNIDKNNKSFDFISCKFNYGTKDMDCLQLRTYYYVNGFTIDWREYTNNNKPYGKDKITYKMLCRSTGKAKEGTCIFINENLYDKANIYLNMGIVLNNDNPMITELSAYKTMTMAHMQYSITLPLKNVLILEEQTSSSKAKAVIVDIRPVEVNSSVNYNAMEEDAQSKGYTFKKNNEYRQTGFDLIENTSIKNLKLIFGDDGIIYKETTNNKNKICNVLDKDVMEIKANEMNLTFFKKKSNNDGFTLIDRNQQEAIERDIKLIYKTEIQEQLYVKRPDKEEIVSNKCWDGMGIIDSSMMPDGCHGFIYCRNHMSKVCLFEGNIIQFLKDEYGDKYETATIKDKFNNLINVRDIRVITTDSAVKWTKFKGVTYADYNNFLEQYDYKWAIVKTAHRSKYEKYNLQRGSFQGYNSLPCLNETELKKIAQTSIDYMNKLKTDDNLFMEHLKAHANNYNINNAFMAIYKRNPLILSTAWGRNERTTIISEYKRKRVMLGKLLQNAENITVAGNVYGLLLYAVGKDWKNDPTLNVISEGIQCYTTRFLPGEELAAYRSPHNSPNNFAYYKNFHHPLMQKYFPNLGDNVIIVNNIGTPTQDRKNGEDYDSDFEHVTNQPEMVKYAKKCYEEYYTIINSVKPISELSEEERKKHKTKIYDTSLESYADLDYNISKYQMGIGESSNVAQLALSYYYNELYRTGEKNLELEDIFIMLSCMAQLFIDAAKKQFPVKLTKELKRIRKLPCMERGEGEKYPWFYAQVQNGKNKIMGDESEKKKEEKRKILDDIELNTISDCKCPMDMLAKIIDKGVDNLTGKWKRGQKAVNIQDILESPKNSDNENEEEKEKLNAQWKDVLNIIRSYDTKMTKLNANEEDYTLQATMLTDECIKDLNRKTLRKTTMHKLILVAFGLDKMKKDNKQICKRILIMLYNMDNSKSGSKFLDSFKKFSSKSL